MQPWQRRDGEGWGEGKGKGWSQEAASLATRGVPFRFSSTPVSMPPVAPIWTPYVGADKTCVCVVGSVGGAGGPTERVLEARETLSFRERVAWAGRSVAAECADYACDVTFGRDALPRDCLSPFF